METNSNVNEIIKASALIALGVLCPFIFHLMGLGGPVFLPMHVPVLIAGILLSPGYALFVGLLTPIMSSLLTGMPPVFPVLPIMLFELSAYAVAVNYFYQKKGVNLYSSLVFSQLIGRLSAGLGVYVIVLISGLKLDPFLYVKGAVITGVPGIILQLLLVPLLVKLIMKYQRSTVIL